MREERMTYTTPADLVAAQDHDRLMEGAQVIAHDGPGAVTIARSGELEPVSVDPGRQTTILAEMAAQSRAEIEADQRARGLRGARQMTVEINDEARRLLALEGRRRGEHWTSISAEAMADGGPDALARLVDRLAANERNVFLAKARARGEV